MKQLIRKALLILWGGVIASLSAVSQTTALSVDGKGNVFIPSGSSYWIGSSTDYGDRLRMHFSSITNQAYIDYSPTLNFRSGINTMFSLGYYSFKWQGVYGALNLDCTTPWGNQVLYPDKDGDFFIGKENNRVWVQAKQVWSVYFTNTSDERVKENIVNLESSLTKLKKLRAVRYDIKKEFLPIDSASPKSSKMKSKNETLRHNNIGLLAQELEKVYPELVTKSDSLGTYGVNYVGLIPVLIQSINEQQSQIETLQSTAQATTKLERRIAQLEAQLDKCCATSNGGKQKSAFETDATTALSTTGTTTPALLGDNTPNPFNQLTVINLGIPETAQKALLTVYDLTGKQLKAYTIATRGQTSHTISANELAPGMYTYALIIDNQLVASKTMVVTE